MKFKKEDFKNCLSNIDYTKYRVSWTLTKLLAAVILVFIFVFSVKGCMNKSQENRELKRKLEEMERKRLETKTFLCQNSIIFFYFFVLHKFWNIIPRSKLLLLKPFSTTSAL